MSQVLTSFPKLLVISGRPTALSHQGSQQCEKEERQWGCDDGDHYPSVLWHSSITSQIYCTPLFVVCSSHHPGTSWISPPAWKIRGKGSLCGWFHYIHFTCGETETLRVWSSWQGTKSAWKYHHAG